MHKHGHCTQVTNFLICHDTFSTLHYISFGISKWSHMYSHLTCITFSCANSPASMDHNKTSARHIWWTFKMINAQIRMQIAVFSILTLYVSLLWNCTMWLSISTKMPHELTRTWLWFQRWMADSEYTVLRFRWQRATFVPQAKPDSFS